MSNLDLNITFADAMTRLSWGTWTYSESKPAAITELTLVAARNEVVGGQVHLTAPQDFVLTVDRANWLHALGFCPRVRLAVDFPTLPAEAVEIFPIGYLEGDDRRQWSEYFERAGYAEVPAYRPQAVYIRLRVPANVETGLHTGQVRAYTQYGFEDETLFWQGAIQLKVAYVTLPDAGEWSYYLDLWQHCTSIARAHRVPLWSEAHFALIDKYYASLAQLGQKAVTVVATEIPWAGQQCFRDRAYPAYLFEHAVIDVSRDESGQLHFDYHKLDRLLALAAKHGINKEIEIFGLLNVWVDEEFGFGKVASDAPDALRVRCYDQKSGAITYLQTADEISLFIQALHGHLQVKNLLDRVRILGDEPSDPALFEQQISFIQNAAPEFKYKVALNSFEFLEDDILEAIDAVLYLPLASQDPALTTKWHERLKNKGGRLLWYVYYASDFPNTFLHSPPLEGRLHGWLTFYLKLDGFLRWNFCLWPPNPWQRVSWRAPVWSAGDMFFVLPGPDGAPVETLRYEALRAAAQDYELLKLVERTLSPDKAQALFDQVFDIILRTENLQGFARTETTPASDIYSLEPQDYQTARRLLLEAIT